MKTIILLALYVTSVVGQEMVATKAQNESSPSKPVIDTRYLGDFGPYSDPLDPRRPKPSQYLTEDQLGQFGCKQISQWINRNMSRIWQASSGEDSQSPPFIMSPRRLETLKADMKTVISSMDSANVSSKSGVMMMPRNYDARYMYPYCPTLQRTEDQGCSCKASWAIAPASALSDRFCISSKGKHVLDLSAQRIISCCSYCYKGHPCDEGSSMWAWVFLRHSGTVTGGPYRSTKGCQNYKIEPCSFGKPNYSRQIPPCEKSCDLPYYTPTIYGTMKSYAHKKTTTYAIEKDILVNGPVTADMKIYEDFYCYRGGIYSHVVGDLISIQTVKIIGWGEENGVKYWLATNFWGERWGERGFFKIVKGRNECDIESLVLAGHPYQYY
uniref:Peptidase C1A papain C-terminal domain-containing protein n=2 Tax=Clastoptera arizonana TaxID=38151 RepID=A0A1B6EDQ5_9HEMI